MKPSKNRKTARSDNSASTGNSRKRANIPPELRKLKVELQCSDDKFVNVEPNALEPTAFETKFFKGVAMLHVRTNPIEPHLECFFVGKKRLFEVQVQGKFKSTPSGEIYSGGQVMKKLELGLITRSVSNAAVKLCSTLVDGLYSSFGDAPSNPNQQMPHLVAPLFATFDKIITTAPGEVPPSMGIPFEEDLNYRKERLAYKSIRDAKVDTETLYSFSINTSNLNLINWTVVNIPLVRPMSVRTFISDIPIQLVAYEIAFEEVARLPPNTHPYKLLNYVFNMKITHCPEGQEDVIVDLPFGGSSDEDEEGADDGSDADNASDSAPADSNAATAAADVTSRSASDDIIAGDGIAADDMMSSGDDDNDEFEADDDLYVDADQFAAAEERAQRPFSMPIIGSSSSSNIYRAAASGIAVSSSDADYTTYGVDDTMNESFEEGSASVFDSAALTQALDIVGDYYQKNSAIDSNQVSASIELQQPSTSSKGNSNSPKQNRKHLSFRGRRNRLYRPNKQRSTSDADNDGSNTTAASETSNNKKQLNAPRQGVGGWIRRHITSAGSTVTQSVTGPSTAAASLAASAAHGLISGVEVASSAAVEAVEIAETADYCHTDYNFESGYDLRFCPASLDLIDRRYDKFKRRTFYFLPLLSSSGEHVLQCDDHMDPQTPRLRSYSEIVQSLSVTAIPRQHKNRRLSRTEKRRRQIIASCMTLLQKARGDQQSNSRAASGERLAISGVGSGGGFLSSMSSTERALNRYESSLLEIEDMDRDFLMGNISVSHRINTRNRSHLWEGHVALAVSSRHWIEYQMLLNRSDVLLYLTEDVHRVTQRIHRRAAVRIPLNSILSVRQVYHEEIPIPGVSFFQIETFPRIYYLMVRSDIQVHGWIEGFVHHLGSEILQSPFDSRLLSPLSILSPSEGAAVPVTGSADTNSSTAASSALAAASANVISDVDSSAATAVKHRSMPALSSGQTTGTKPLRRSASSRVFELEGETYLAKSASWKLDKKRLFNYRRIIFSPNNLPEKFKAMRPTEVMESLLANAFYLSNADLKLESNALRWVSFLEDLSCLQVLDLSALVDEREKVAFFLNLHHVMVLHGGLVVGYPPAWNYWNAFFNNLCYLVSYDIYSIADIEFNVLKAAMSRPSSLSMMVPIPNHQYPSVAVTQRDFRLHFCINSGSRSMPNVVPIYRADCLDDQLDEMTELCLKESFEPVDYHKRLISLPKLPLQDFSSSSVGTATPADCLRHLAHYLPRSEKPILLRMLAENVPFTVRFKPSSMKCRKFYLYSEDAEEVVPEGADSDGEYLSEPPVSSEPTTPSRAR